ncbi:CooT family nickel-binding protein [Candidatus Bathyarchaeota archaeon]|nr:CooT family nickel-binding protein [Candidatus Bathyarchaeota archaeon]
MSKMCEFKVFLEDEEIMRDVIYAREEGDKVILRDVLGETRIVEGAKILEVDVSAVRLLLGKT